jgi:hypothetical protein
MQKEQHQQGIGLRQQHRRATGAERGGTQHEACVRPAGSARGHGAAPPGQQACPSDTAPDSAVRVQPNCRVIGSTKIDIVSTAPPWREKPAQHVQARMTQP